MPPAVTSKHPLKSKTIWGVLISTLGFIVDNAAALEQSFPDWAWIPKGVMIAGILLSLYGRLKAEGKIVISMLLMCFMIPACASVDPTQSVDQNVDGQELGNTAMNATTLITPDETYTDTSTTGLTTVDQDSSGMNVATHGPGTSSAMDLVANRLFAFSGGDFSVDEIVIDERADESRTITIKGVNSTASEVIRAANEGYDRLIVVWSQFSQDQRDVAIQQLQTQGAFGEALIEILATIPVR